MVLPFKEACAQLPAWASETLILWQREQQLVLGSGNLRFHFLSIPKSSSLSTVGFPVAVAMSLPLLWCFSSWQETCFWEKKTSHVFRGESWKMYCWICGVFSALFLCNLLRKQSRWTVADPSLVMLFPSYGWSRACLKLAARGSSNPQMSPSSPPGTCYWSHLNETRKEKSSAWSRCQEKEEQFDVDHQTAQSCSILPQSCLWVDWQEQDSFGLSDKQNVKKHDHSWTWTFQILVPCNSIGLTKLWKLNNSK